MLTKEEIAKHLESVLDDPKYFVVDLRVSNSKIRRKITILMDSDDGILIDECAAISRKLAEVIDEEIEGAYTLEVSSPGTDFPITTARQLKRVLNKDLKVVFPDGNTTSGQLLSVDNDSFQIQPPKKKKEKTTQGVQQIKLSEIKEAKVQVSFK